MIQEENIVFLESQVMQDVPEGGGAATGNIIVDGATNNIFEDVSDLDRAYGRFNLRKLFVGVRSQDTDLYLGAKVAITKPPTDEALGYTIFTDNDQFSVREDIVGRLESYLYKSSVWHGYLRDAHRAGTQTLTIVQKATKVVPLRGDEYFIPSMPLPSIGQTFCITENEGLSTEKEQYVKIKAFTTEARAYLDTKGVYYRIIIFAEITAPLEHDFTGYAVQRYDDSMVSESIFRDTAVTGAGKYFGVTKLAQAASIGDREVFASTIFAPLVPTAETEEILVNQIPADAINTEIFGFPISVTGDTTGKLITAENRSISQIFRLAPSPAPGTVSLSFMAQGNWYRLQDDAEGNVNGANAADGVGTIDYATGDLAVTLGALPDIGVHIIVSWGTTLDYRNLVTGQDGGTGDDENAPGDGGAGASSSLEAELPGTAILSTITATWQSGGIGKSLTCDSTGQISGDATGWAIREVIPARSINRVLVSLDFGENSPDGDTTFAYDEGTPVTQTIAVTPIGNSVTTIVPTAGIVPGSFSVSWKVRAETEEDSKTVHYRPHKEGGTWKLSPYYSEDGGSGYKEYVLTLPDDGLGGIVFKQGETTGSLNYATGALSLTVYPSLISRVYDPETYKWVESIESLALLDGQIQVAFLES